MYPTGQQAKRSNMHFGIVIAVVDPEERRLEIEVAYLVETQSAQGKVAGVFLTIVSDFHFI